MDYAVVEISGRQYKVIPGKELEVDFLGDIKTLECEKVLLIAQKDDLQVGAPFLKTKLNFEVLGSERKAKIRVAKYHAKANTRKVTGSRKTVSKIKLAV